MKNKILILICTLGLAVTVSASDLDSRLNALMHAADAISHADADTRGHYAIWKQDIFQADLSDLSDGNVKIEFSAISNDLNIANQFNFIMTPSGSFKSADEIYQSDPSVHLFPFNRKNLRFSAVTFISYACDAIVFRQDLDSEFKKTATTTIRVEVRPLPNYFAKVLFYREDGKVFNVLLNSDAMPVEMGFSN